jgi:hypothetical protein
MAESGVERIKAIHWTGLSAAESRAHPLESVETPMGHPHQHMMRHVS